MPTYEYRCRTCDVRFEVQQSFSEDSLTHCPGAASEQGPAACVAPGEGEVRKVFSAPSITFKGDGFYKTDSRSGATRSANGKKSGDDTSTGSESTESTKETTGGTKESSGDSGGEPASDRTPAGATSS
ncbi:MAG: zinc ribbon domain-containing protein [Acidimicrobiia bacterium]|nr:zinc ribbon domain-containing protein [Acidimicrobiia bacterium]MYC46324.1 zinc ribbon domain-containing protein [Acidimicrobiia bacterium]